MKSIAVFCGSRLGKDAAYAEAAIALGKLLAARNIRVISGGADAGIMPKLAASITASGGTITTVLVKSETGGEIPIEDVTECVSVDGTAARKSFFLHNADGYILLPGGIGTADEFFTILVDTQSLGTRKPIGVLNINGYYNPLLAFLGEMTRSGFAKDSLLSNILVGSEPSKLIEMLLKESENKSRSYRAMAGVDPEGIGVSSEVTGSHEQSRPK